MACISQRYARANNNNVIECDLEMGRLYLGWNKSKESCHLLDFDTNALYTLCMSHSQIRWV